MIRNIARAGRLAVLVAASLVLTTFSSPASAADATFSTDARMTLDTYAALVEQHLSSALTGLAAVASTEEAASGQWDRIRGPLTAVSRRIPAAAAVWFVQPDGAYYTVTQGLTGQTLSDRAYFPTLMAGNDVSADLVISKSTGKRSAIVATPIRVDGRVIGGLGASIDLEKLAAAVDAAMGPPSDIVFYALDAQGRTTLHRDTARIFEFPSEVGSTSLRSAVAKMLRSRRGNVTYTYKGSKRTVVFEKSTATGWVFALGKAAR